MKIDIRWAIDGDRPAWIWNPEYIRIRYPQVCTETIELPDTESAYNEFRSSFEEFVSTYQCKTHE